MKVNFLNKNNNISLSKRTKSGDKDKYQTIMNNKMQNNHNYNHKYMSYFQSPKKGEDLLFIKKKFQKMKKNTGEKTKNETSNNANNINNSNNIISESSSINFMSPINKNYYNKKQNNALTKYLKNQLILNSIDANNSNINNIIKNNNSNENDITNRTSTKLSSNNNLNFNINKKVNKSYALSNKHTSDLLDNNSNRINYNLKKENKKPNKENIKLNKNSFKFSFFNNLSSNNSINKHLNKAKLYSIKGMVNNKKINKNFSNSNQNLSNTMFEIKNSSNYNNNINYFENYIKAVALSKANKYSINKSISSNISNNFNISTNLKKPSHNMTFNSNTLSGVATTRDPYHNNNNPSINQKISKASMIQSPKVNISKTTKSSPKSSFSIINKINKKLKGHIKNKSISILTKDNASFLFKKNSIINNGSKMNSNNKINYNIMSNMNYTTLNDKGNYNLYSKNGPHYKLNQNMNKKMHLIEIENNYNNYNKKPKVNSPFNIYYKKKTQPNSNENSLIKNKLNNKINITKNGNFLKILDINNISNNNKNQNIYVNKNHLSKHKNLSSLNNSTRMNYNHINNSLQDNNDVLSAKSHHQYQKTEDIIVNNYNININNQINNTNTYISGNIIEVDSKKKDKNDKNGNSNNKITLNENNINLKKKKLFSQSLKDILISNNKNTKIFTSNNSPISKDILLNVSNNNYIKNNNNKNNESIKTENIKYTYNKWSSTRDKKEPNKKRVFDSLASQRKNEDIKNININIDNKNLNKKNNNITIESQRKYIETKKKLKEELEKKKNNNSNNLNITNNKPLSKINSLEIKIIDKSNISNNTNNSKNNNKNNNSINNRNDITLTLSLHNPSLSSRSSISFDSNYYMKESLKLSHYISKYYNRYKKYPPTSLQFYKYGRLIGQGAFGKVNLGLNILTGRIVAVKSFDKNNTKLTGDNMKKILYETDLMKKLNHPNITKILEMFEDEKYFMIIMEYINGGNLFSFVKKRRKLSEKTAKFLFRQIILGIKYIHEQNIVHRDIKLENLLIDLNNNVKICDFGIGRKIKNKNQLLHDQCGTLMYMAPEILLSSKEKGYEGFPVDIWSSGISLYIMLSGTLPFNYKNKKKDEDDDEADSENEEEEDSFSDDNSKSKKDDDDNFKLQYSIVYKEPKKIEKISDEARDLLKGLLNKDPKKRLTCDQILNHPWLNNFKEKNISSKKFHLFTKAEMIMLSKTFIDYRKGNYEDLKENFTLSNLETNSKKKKSNSKEENITNKSSILAPYNSIISESEENSENNNDSFDDFNNNKIKLEKDIMTFSRKIKEFNRLYELNNNGEVDNGVLINSKTQSSINMTDRSSSKNEAIGINLNISTSSHEDFAENNKNKINNKSKNENKKVDEEAEKKIKINNILNQMALMGYDKKYVFECVKNNELCHASAVYYLMMNYENI